MTRHALIPVACLSLVLAAPAARGQDPMPPGCTEESREEKAARHLYEEALIQEATGNLGAAREMYQRVVREHPATPFACWAHKRLTALLEGKARVNKEGRAQFITGTTLFGAWLADAIATAIFMNDDDVSESEAKGLIWAGIGGAAASLVPAILFSSDLPMSTGRATLINFGWTWGLWHGLACSILPDDLSVSAWFGIAAASSAVGWGGTFALTHYLDVADGDAALVSSAAGWSTWIAIATGALIGAGDFFDNENIVIPVALAGGDAGLITASLLTGEADMSAGRVGLINLGGLLGGMLAGGIIALGEIDEGRAAVGLALGLTMGGLLGAFFLTTGYDEPGNGATGMAVLEHTPEGWAVGAPVPRLTPAVVEGRHTLAFELPLLGGRF